MAVALSLMASLYLHENKLALAGEALDEAITRVEECMGPEHPQMAVMLEMRADIFSRRGETQSARDDLARARNIMAAHFGADSTAMAGVLVAMGNGEQTRESAGWRGAGIPSGAAASPRLRSGWHPV